jgi:hypothetical protein
MQRLRHILIAAAMVAASLALTFDAKAQPGGGGRGGRGGGPGGPGGWGGFGGFGGGLLNLVQNPAVQEELKLKDPQKTKIQALNETANQSRQQIRDQMAPQGQQNQGGRRNRNNGNANGPGGQNAGGNGGGQNGGFAGGNGGGQNGGFAGGNGGGQNGGFAGQSGGFAGQNGGNGGPGGNGPGGGRGNRGQQDPEAAQRFAMMREAMNEIQQASEQALARILDRGQFGRLKQIQLQLDGVRALTRPDMAEKLSLSDDQVEEIQGLLDQSQQARRENGRAWGEMMKTAFPNPNPGNNGQNGGGQNGGGAQNGGRGGRGGMNPRDPAFQEAMKNFMERPEVKAKMEEMQTQNEQIQNQLNAAVNRVLGKRAATAYKKMLGAQFDLSKIRGGPGQGPWNRNRNGNQANATKSASKAEASNSGDEDGAATAKPAAKSNTTTAKPKRKSLRELRGLDQ